MIDVDFEWFDPQPDVDFQGIKTLLRQLLDADSQMFDLSALTDLILAQPLLGSTVKVDGNMTDPYAFLTVLNVKEHLVWLFSTCSNAFLKSLQEKPSINELMTYLKGRANWSNNSGLINQLNSDSSTIGLILTERLINVPSEISPPMYKMLLEEIQWAVEEKEPYAFTHFLILSKTYQEVASNSDEEDDSAPKAKKQKKSRKERYREKQRERNGGIGGEIFYFHPEDEVLHKNALEFVDFDYVKNPADSQSDSKKTFQELGIKPRGHMILLEAAKLESAITDMTAYFGQN